MCNKYDLDTLNDYIKKEVGAGLKAKIEEHLETCKDCSMKAEKLKKLNVAFKRIKDKQAIKAKSAFNAAVLNRFAKHKENPLTKIFRLVYAPVVVIGAVIIFIFAYSTYIQDKYIVNLRISLDVLSAYSNVIDVKIAKPVTKFILAGQVAKAKKDNISIINLEFIDKIVNIGTDDAQIRDVKAFMFDELYRKENERGALLTALDKTMFFFNRNIFGTSLAVADVSETKNIEIVEKILSEGRRFKLDKQKIVKDFESKTESERMKAYMDLGSKAMQYFDYEGAIEFFEKCKFNSNTDKTIIDFNIAWCKKQLGRYEEAISDFDKISGGGNYKDLCMYEQANTNEQAGKYDAAAVMYQVLSDETSDRIVKSLAKFNEGYTYLYGLNNPDKAKEVFKLIEREYKDMGISQYVKSNILKKVEEKIDFANLPRVFKESFETDDMKEWEIEGNYNISSEQKHSGLRSLKLLPGSIASWKINKKNVYAKLTMWVYDSKVGGKKPTGNTDRGPAWGTENYDGVIFVMGIVDKRPGSPIAWGPYFWSSLRENDMYSWWYPGKPFEEQNVKLGWHKWVFNFSDDKTLEVVMDDEFKADIPFEKADFKEGFTKVFLTGGQEKNNPETFYFDDIVVETKGAGMQGSQSLSR